ncbi:MAG: aldehyde dehydrogenase family protein, partial [Oceanospirillum sp.]|nr:aldehyde dehydrogenase family protein [Oceanospirillum sp.]
MLQASYPYYLANEPVTPNQDLTVTNKYTGEIATRVAMADVDAIDRAIAAANEASDAMRKMPAFKRQQILEYCVKRFQERFEELAQALCIEAGKPIKDARGEVTRLIDTFKIAAEEATRIYGEVIPMDISPRANGYSGQWKRVPIGPCSFISPFNFPLNLAAHKVAPAIAAGCPFILKPASLTPIGALIIGEVLAETDLPKGAFSILPCHRDGADLFTTDDRLKLLSFTGSPEVGWNLKAKAGKKPVVLELGGNAACIVDEGTDLEDAVARIVFGAYYQSGQSCISVQRIMVHESLYDEARERLIKAVGALVHGDPADENTFIGPMISEKEAARLHGWVEAAKAGGAKVLAGGNCDGAMLEATLLEDVSPEMDVSCQEAFGPVAILSKFSDYDAALEEVNNSDFGLQAGIFTKDIYKAQKAWDELEVGGVVIGDVPSWRVDHMPYGGVKDSGIG